MDDPPPTTAPRTESGSGIKPADFGSLARRITGWTANGLATALILVAGLTFGRQVLLWWREEPAATSPHKADLASLEDGIKHLQFGALTGPVQTRKVSGSRDDVLAALRDMCRPSERPGAQAGVPMNEAEQRLLAELAGKEPAEAGDGWRIDQLPQGLPLVICSTTAGNRSPPKVPLDLRILAIGLAVPAPDDAWSAYAFRLAVQSPAAGAAEPFPLPVGSTRGITLTQPDGTTLTTFRGQGTPAAWEAHLAALPPGSGWQLRANSAPSRRRHYEFDRAGAKSFRAEVTIEYDGQGELCGLVLVTPENKP